MSRIQVISRSKDEKRAEIVIHGDRGNSSTFHAERVGKYDDWTIRDGKEKREVTFK